MITFLRGLFGSTLGKIIALAFVVLIGVLFLKERITPDQMIWMVGAFIGVVLGSILTAAYGARFLWGAFATKPHTITW